MGKSDVMITKRRTRGSDDERGDACAHRPILHTDFAPRLFLSGLLSPTQPTSASPDVGLLLPVIWATEGSAQVAADEGMNALFRQRRFYPEGYGSLDLVATGKVRAACLAEILRLDVQILLSVGETLA